MKRSAAQRVVTPVRMLVIGGLLVGTAVGQESATVPAIPPSRNGPGIDLLEKSSVAARSLGVRTTALPDAVRAQIGSLVPEGSGLLVTRVVPDTPAASAGVQRYDVLLAVDRTEIAEPGDLDAAVATLRVGERALLRIVRGGRPTTLAVRVAARPEAVVPATRGEEALARAAIPYARTQAPRAPERREAVPLAEGPIVDRSILVTAKPGRSFDVVVHEGERRWTWTADGADSKRPDDLPEGHAADVVRLLTSAESAREKGVFRFRVQPRANEVARSVVLLLQQPGAEDEYRLFEIERTLSADDGETLPVHRLLETDALRAEFEHLAPAVREKLKSALERFRVPPVQVRVREPR